MDLREPDNRARNNLDLRRYLRCRQSTDSQKARALGKCADFYFIPSLDDNDPLALASSVMAGLDPAIQTPTVDAWMPGSRPGMTAKVVDNETWYYLYETVVI